MSAPGNRARLPGFGDVKPELISRLKVLVRELCPGGKFAGNYYMTKNPTRADRHAGSFWVLMKGSAAGAWRDEAGAPDEYGDIIGLVKHTQNLSDNKETLTWCVGWLGWSNVQIDPAKADAQREKVKQELAALEKQEKLDFEKNQKRALGMWLRAEKKLTGTVLEKYLNSRGVDFSKLKKEPGALRLFAAHDHSDLDGEITTWPCMISAMSDKTGKIRAVHRTWIKADGSDKAPVKPVRKIWPAGYAGCVIRIAKGKGNLSPEEAGRRGEKAPLLITEGIEDALCLAISAPDYRIWAAGTLGNIGNVPVLPCVSQILIAADNDWNNPQAQAQLTENVAALKRNGVPVTVVHSWIGKDVNDLMKGH